MTERPAKKRGESRAALDARSAHLRREILGVVRHSRRGHVGSAFSIVEILRVLYDDILRVDPRHPERHDRDRFILSKGHGCLALYVQLAERGFFAREVLASFCEDGSLLGGHPQAGKVPGVEASTGSLGHGLPVGVGIALHGKLTGRDFRTVVLLGDGECNEGTVWEAALCAAKHSLERLTVLVDYNKLQCYGPTAEVLDLEPLAAKWRSFGFAVREVDGHDVRALRRVFRAMPFAAGRPAAIICHTVKGRGIARCEGNPQWHHKSRISDAEFEGLEAELAAGCAW
ncbi:MAG: transketolase [Candidatus Methylomirabilia bacterium]